MRRAAETLAPHLGVAPTCRALGVPRTQWYRARARASAEPANSPPRALPCNAAARALSVEERATVLTTLNSPRFVDQVPREVYARLLDEGRYLCSWRQMYRILTAHAQVRERRDQLRHPAYTRPELLATQPNAVWSWDITKLLGPHTWVYYYLYVVLDIFSRYVVGWMVAGQESAALAQDLIAASCAKQGIRPGQLTLHADRGAPMLSKSLAQLLIDLGVAPSHARAVNLRPMWATCLRPNWATGIPLARIDLP